MPGMPDVTYVDRMPGSSQEDARTPPSNAVIPEGGLLEAQRRTRQTQQAGLDESSSTETHRFSKVVINGRVKNGQSGLLKSTIHHRVLYLVVRSVQAKN